MKLTLKQIRKTVLFLIFALVCGGIGYGLGQREIRLAEKNTLVKIVNRNVPVEKELDFDLFWKVWGRVEEKYLQKKSLDEEQMFYGAIKGMVAAAGDPYTVFLPPKANEKVREDLNGSFEGVGIQLGFNKDKRLVVMAPLKGMPAEAAGVKAGDLILHLKDEQKGLDEDSLDISLPEAVEKIRGAKGAPITLTLLHEGATETYETTIIRGTIVVPSVKVDLIDKQAQENEQNPEFAHLKLMRFGDLTAQQWDESIVKIKNQNENLKGIVLDLRGNPGGYLNGAVNLAAEFLSSGVIVKQEDYLGQTETYSVNRRGRLLDVPLVVLIDRGSASASEILAGALQDHNRAKLVGETSFGKGTIQESEEVNGGSALHITTAKWLTPNGVWVNENGLVPDVVVEDDLETEDKDEQLIKAIEILTQDGLK